MSTPRGRHSPLQPQPQLAAHRSESPASFAPVSLGTSAPRAELTARLASPIPTYGTPPPSLGDPSAAPTDNGSTSATPLAGRGLSVPGPGISALAAALSNSLGTSPPRHGTPPVRTATPSMSGAAQSATQQQPHTSPTHYGSFDIRSRSTMLNTTGAYEDAEIVKRHLVQPSDAASDDSGSGQGRVAGENNGGGGLPGGGDDDNDDEFSSLRLQGGDITRPIYKWSEEADQKSRMQRSKSFSHAREEPENEALNINSIKVPGGFRRNFLRRAAANEQNLSRSAAAGAHDEPRLFTSSFIEFLSIYGHFAGEELEEDDEVLRPGESFVSDQDGEDVAEADMDGGGGGSDSDREPMEDSVLLPPLRRKRKRKMRGGSGQSGAVNAAMLLLKSFVGTGVLFLPRAYLNGGMLFSNLVLLFVAALSYYCFVLLVTTRMRVVGSFGDIGGILYGGWMRTLILTSIVISQIGFVAAYIVFTSKNLQAFILALSHCKMIIETKWLIIIQMIIFMPFSLLRDIEKLGFTALIADGFIVIGLAYLFYYDIFTLATHGLADIVMFNGHDWTLFIGTAIFTFEGVGLIIPIQESMKEPRKFPRVLFVVMIIITTVFIVMGAVSYAAYGSETETVVLLNLPQDDKMVNAVQFLYSAAILLSTPLQIFPAVRITENALFTRSGKYNPYIKWQKNIYRFFVVALCAAIAWGGADNLDKFVALVGNFACIPLVYVYPPLLHYRGVATSSLQKGSDILLCVLGLVAMIYTTSLTVMSWANASGGDLPSYCDPKKL